MTETTITLDSSRDSITFTPTGADVDIFGAAPTGGAFIYRDECLDDWYALPKPIVNLAKRANAHGAFALGQTFTDAATPSVSGRYHGLSHADAADARERLAAMYNDGNPIVMRVADVRGVTSRVVWVTDFVPDWTATDTFEFEMALVAPDGRRYGPLQSSPGTGLPTPPSGLLWPLGTSPSGLYFDWGTAGTDGLIAMTNGGNATAYPTVYVGGTSGAFPDGFRVTEVETGREVVFPYPVPSGTVIAINNRTRRVTQDGGGDVTELTSKREWFMVPSGATRNYLISTLGNVSGAPTFRATMMPANL